MSDSIDPLLAVRDLTVDYPVREGVLRRQTAVARAVDGVSFALDRGEALGVVGESGCGKSTLARALLHLEAPTGGDVLFDGDSVTGMGTRDRRRFRRRTGMVFQDAGASFDPRMSVGESVVEPLVVQGLGTRAGRRERGVALLERVGLRTGTFDRFPHELSGGQRQRAALARALVTDPSLLVLDEPTSALDVSVGAAVLSLLSDLAAERNLGVVFVSHDLDAVRSFCDRVAVMYLGEFVERGPTDRVLADPRHPYTRALVEAIPTPDPHRPPPEGLSGEVPSPVDPPDGCRFHTRCPAVIRPPGVDLDGRTWRDLLTLRDHLAGDLDRVAVQEFPGADDDPRAAVRSSHDLPAELGDATVEEALGDALDALLAGDDDGAADRLGEVVTTPCERRHPDLRTVEPDHEAACLLCEREG